MQAADAVDIFVEAAVVEVANDHAHGMAHERVVEAGQLPCAQVAGDDEDALAARLRREVVFQTLGAHPVARVLGGVARHAAELDELPAQMDIDALENFFPGLEREFGEGQLKIAHAHAPQPAEAPVNGKGKAAGEPRAISRGMRPRQPATARTSPYSRSSRIDERKNQCRRSARGVRFAHSPKIGREVGGGRLLQDQSSKELSVGQFESLVKRARLRSLP